MTSSTHLEPAAEAPHAAAHQRNTPSAVDAEGTTPVKRLAPGEVLTIAVLAISAFLAILSEMVLGVALPQVMADLGVPATTGQWLTTGYALTLAVIIPTTGFVMQRFQLRTIFLTSVGVFGLGCVISAAAPNFELLLAGRIVQAVGTAVLVPLLLTTTIGLADPSRRGQMMALVTAVTAVAPALGPAFSGIVLSQLSWRWLFIILAPLAFLCLAVGAVKMPNLTTPRPVTFDAVSLVLSAIGFGALVYGLASTGESSGGHLSASVLIAVAVGVLGIGAFVVRQLRLQRRDAAVLDMRIFSYPAFNRPVIAFTFLVPGAFSLTVLLPLVMQESLGLGALQTGLLMAPGGATIAIVSMVVGRWYDRVGARGLAIPGLSLVVAGWSSMFTFNEQTSVWVVLATFVVICTGQAFAWVAIFTMALGALPQRLTPHGSAALNTVQQLAGAAGLAVLVAVLSRYAGGTDPADIIRGARAAFAVGAVVASLALMTTFFLPRDHTQRPAEQDTGRER